ncbi:CPBP family intramembrane glutamic endopeptidase [Chengkuizengella sediminis]|uniref:CPBP family intramembrane glutamic endopeptidase n=1 Tax=Chengkuizengella sediminis TaxID=1885917 RepID=UPI00138A1F32|nr:type II CAAX endopeptidase family protein [Chengkuizengella sediminis]NDI34394.1 CPBP family intramembrane metalloprotease [Chengkuizengella sediminis]
MSETNNTLLKVIGKVLLSLLLALFITFIYTIISTSLYVLISNDPVALETIAGSVNLKEPMIVLVLYIPQALGFISAAILMYIIFEKKQKWFMGWKQSDWGKQFFFGSLIGILLMSISFLMIWILGGITIESVRSDSQLWFQLALALVIFILTAVNEELFCRGYLQGLFKYHYGAWPAILSSSFIFAGLHMLNLSVFDSPIPLINIFLAGVLLAVSREVSGGLWMPIGIHLTWNYFQGNIFGFEVSGNEVNSLIKNHTQGLEFINGGLFGAEGSVVATFVLLVAIFSFIKMNHKQHSYLTLSLRKRL